MSEARGASRVREGSVGGARARAGGDARGGADRGRGARGARHCRRGARRAALLGGAARGASLIARRRCARRAPRGDGSRARARRSRTRWAARRFGISRWRSTSACSSRGRRRRCSWTRCSTRERTGLAIDIGTGIRRDRARARERGHVRSRDRHRRLARRGGRGARRTRVRLAAALARAGGVPPGRAARAACAGDRARRGRVQSAVHCLRRGDRAAGVACATGSRPFALYSALGRNGHHREYHSRGTGCAGARRTPGARTRFATCLAGGGARPRRAAGIAMSR